MKAFIISIIVTLYHFLYRIIIGETVSKFNKYKPLCYTSIFLHNFAFENNLYKALNVKKWKNKMITAKPYKFNMFDRNLNQILNSMLIAEKVHLLCFPLSYLPMFLIIPFGAPCAFFLTSFLASLIDLACIMIQRYNIPRIIRLINLKYYQKVCYA